MTPAASMLAEAMEPISTAIILDNPYIGKYVTVYSAEELRSATMEVLGFPIEMVSSNVEAERVIEFLETKKKLTQEK